ncbi:hypothetical protein J6590_059183 [Homalodisca vitripennis]|nr:hypothetical protein J6590_059183 [Homalodisca vitripennis]
MDHKVFCRINVISTYMWVARQLDRSETAGPSLWSLLRMKCHASKKINIVLCFCMGHDGSDFIHDGRIVPNVAQG